MDFVFTDTGESYRWQLRSFLCVVFVWHLSNGNQLPCGLSLLWNSARTPVGKPPKTGKSFQQATVQLKKTHRNCSWAQSRTQNLQLTFLLLPPDLTEKQSPYIPGIKPPLDAITWLYNIYIYIYMQWITAKYIYNIQHSNFLIDDRLYSTIFHSLEQTRWTRTWFYMSD